MVPQHEVLRRELGPGGKQDRDEATDKVQHPKSLQNRGQIRGFYLGTNLLLPDRKSCRIKADGIFGRDTLLINWE